ncbi:MAG TPA: DUF2867 domain-containing protein [Candidatus Rhabdochlamydia sp.]|jgi:nucleoside-diphosphate-sugar epimerase|nr:DUF2867 domain-containing protein [Candidatus Rhabdochlamydia sp.]
MAKTLVTGSTGFVGKRLINTLLEQGHEIYALCRIQGGGVGLNRGRRHPSKIQVGDAIDFWQVLHADKKGANLILYAGMKLLGEAWLQFKIENRENKDFLIQIATFRPKRDTRTSLLVRISSFSLLDL